MKKTAAVTFLVVLTVVLALVVFRHMYNQPAPRPVTGGEARSVSAQSSTDTSFCADTLAISGGTLCALAPSKTDARILDSSPATGEKGDAILGFGYHVVGFPDDTANAKGIWIHFAGSYGRAYDIRTDDFSTKTWLNEIMGAGYVVIQLAYDNRFSVNGDLCGRRNDGYNRDNCAGEVREIGLTGEGLSPYRSTDNFNTIDYRLQMLLSYLEKTQGINLPGTLNPDKLDWSTLSISGHSQGANQAYYIAKKRQVAFACILAGGYDTQDNVNPGEFKIADWFTEGASQTPTDRIRAFLTTTDDSYTAFYNGLTQAVHLPPAQIIVAKNETYINENGDEVNGHAGSIKDPSLKSLRAEACFNKN